MDHAKTGSRPVLACRPWSPSVVALDEWMGFCLDGKRRLGTRAARGASTRHISTPVVNAARPDHTQFCFDQHSRTLWLQENGKQWKNNSSELERLVWCVGLHSQCLTSPKAGETQARALSFTFTALGQCLSLPGTERPCLHIRWTDLNGNFKGTLGGPSLFQMNQCRCCVIMILMWKEKIK